MSPDPSPVSLFVGRPDNGGSTAADAHYSFMGFLPPQLASPSGLAFSPRISWRPGSTRPPVYGVPSAGRVAC